MSSDVESRTTKGEGASGLYRSDTEPSEVQDQLILKAEALLDGHQSDAQDPHDGNQSINSGHSRESVSCEKVIKVLTEVINSSFARNTALPEHIQADVPMPAQSRFYAELRDGTASASTDATKRSSRQHLDAECPPRP